MTESPREGWAVRSEGGLSVGLDTELTDALREAGLLRDVLRRIQDARRTLGLEVSDRIELWWSAGREDVAAALRAGVGTVAEEVLAVAVKEGAPASTGVAPQVADELDLTLWIVPVGR